METIEFELNENPDYIIVGMDTDPTYPEVHCSFAIQLGNGATFIGTNADMNLPAEEMN